MKLKTNRQGDAPKIDAKQYKIPKMSKIKNTKEKRHRDSLKKTLKSDGAFPYLCLLPSLIGVMIFFIIPFCVIIYYLCRRFCNIPEDGDFILARC